MVFAVYYQVGRYIIGNNKIVKLFDYLHHLFD